MELSREHPGDKVHVRSVGSGSITVSDERYEVPVILSPDAVEANWDVRRFEDFSEESLRPVLRFEPEIVIVGTGDRQRFLEPALMMLFHRAGIGIEVMNTRAACRTFNILVMEERRVVAALIPPEAA